MWNRFQTTTCLLSRIVGVVDRASLSVVIETLAAVAHQALAVPASEPVPFNLEPVPDLHTVNPNGRPVPSKTLKSSGLFGLNE